MAIRSTNAGRHGASSSRSGGTADDLARDMKASKGRSSSSSGSSRERIDYRDPANNGPFYPGTRRQEFRDDPNWRYPHTPGSDRGAHTGWWETSGKNLSDVHAPWVPPDAAWYAQDAATRAENRAHTDRVNAVLMADPEYVKAKAAGDRRGMNAAQMRLKDNIQRQKFIAQGGRGETWDDRFKRDWPVPRSTNGQYWYRPPGANGPNDPGLPGPAPSNVARGESGGGGRTASGPRSADSTAGGSSIGATAGPAKSGYAGQQFSVYGGSDSRDTPPSGRELIERLLDRPATQRTGGAGGIQGYIGADGGGLGDFMLAESMPQGMSFDMPSNNIISALETLKGDMAGGRGVSARPPSFAPSTISRSDVESSAPSRSSASRVTKSSTSRGVRRGGGRMD